MSTSEYPILECPPPLVMMDRTIKWKPNNIELAPNCPRCASPNTKFCYYNNYSLSQPRYFCKACRRYWTKGGSLRNVPVGGGCRKSRRSRATKHGGGTSYAGPARCVGLTSGVFAKYVTSTDESNCENFESCNNVQASSLEDSSTMFEYGKSVDLVINWGDDELQQVYEYIDGQDFLGQNDHNANFEGINLDGQLGTDVLWSEMGTNMPSLGSQESMMELQDFDMFSHDDQFRLSANVVSENWDLSGYENFHNPFI